jgi:hypothetical protein
MKDKYSIFIHYTIPTSIYVSDILTTEKFYNECKYVQ